MVKARGRKKAALPQEIAPPSVQSLEPETPNLVLPEIIPEVAAAPLNPEAPTPKKRGRPKANVAQVVELALPKARGRKPKALIETAIEPEENSADLESSAPKVEVLPQKQVRVRREAKEHVFSHQASLYNPYLDVLEQIRATPGGVLLRDLSTELDAEVLRRLGGRKGLEEAVLQLEQRQELLSPKKGTIQASRELVPIVGRLEVRADGSGWLTPDTPSLRPMLIPTANLLFAWHGDRVVARELQRVPQSTGEVIRVLERSRQTVTGTLEFKRGYALLRPDEANLPALALEATGLVAGTRLVVKPLYPEDTGEDEAVARVQEVLGDAGSVNSERAAIITRLGLPTEFSKEVLTQASKLGKITAKDLKGRIDLRGKRVYALPGLETALQIEPLGNGNVLLAIHYADSGYWVDEATALEQAILERGASVDLGEEHLPMLPAPLLADLQFTPSSERLSLSVLIETTAQGDLVNYVVRPSVVAIAEIFKNATLNETELLNQIGGLSTALGLAQRLCATAIAASDVTALYRVPGTASAELPAALERSNGFDPDSIAIRTLKQRLTKSERIEAIHSHALTDGLSLENPLSKAVDFLNLRILGWCATKLSQRKREMVSETLPNLALPLKRLEQRASEAQTSLFQFQAIAALHQTYPMRGVVVSISEFALEIVLENGAIGSLNREDLGEELVFTPNQWKTRLGRVFKPGSIVRVVLHKTRPATREAALWLHQKESPMSRLRRRKQGANTGAKPSVGSSTPKRGVVVLGHRPRAEYPRPVRITARKLYFGEWTRAQFAELEGDNPEFEVSRPVPRPHQQNQPRQNYRPQHQRDQKPNQVQRPNQPQAPALRRAQAAPDVSRAPVADAATRASRIESLRQRQLQALERNANRTSAGPALVPQEAAKVPSENAATTAVQKRNNRRRGSGRKTQSLEN